MPNRRRWIIALGACALLALLVAALMSFLDWRLNPGGLFHRAGMTQWDVVRATFSSWFWPVFVLTLVIVVPVGLWLTRSR